MITTLIVFCLAAIGVLLFIIRMYKAALLLHKLHKAVLIHNITSDYKFDWDDIPTVWRVTFKGLR